MKKHLINGLNSIKNNMCRLFASKSLEKESPKHWFFESKTPLVNFLLKPLSRGPHDCGWGVAWNSRNKWKVYKEGKEDTKTYNFETVRNANSQTVLIHLRKSFGGKKTSDNAHPFLYNKFAFEHNGTVNKEYLLGFLPAKMKKNLKSNTDSEVFFLVMMRFYEETGNILEAIKKTIEIASKKKYTSMNFILSDGKKIYAYRNISESSKKLKNYYSLYYLKMKKEVILCSEKLSDDAWQLISPGNLLIVKNNLDISLIKL